MTDQDSKQEYLVAFPDPLPMEREAWLFVLEYEVSQENFDRRQPGHWSAHEDGVWIPIHSTGREAMRRRKAMQEEARRQGIPAKTMSESEYRIGMMTHAARVHILKRMKLEFRAERDR